VRNADRESGDDRNSENAIRHRDVGECNNRNPDDVQERNHHADAFGAEPVQPAETVFALLLTREPVHAR
jgi:hypothetical protein